MNELEKFLKPNESLTPLLKHAWNSMPNGFKKVIIREDPIVTVSAKAREIAKKDKNFARSDIGQITGILPELEVHYGPPIGKPELRSLIAEFWTKLYKLPNLTQENVAITTGATEALGILVSLLAYQQKILLASPHWPTFPDTITRAGAEYVRLELVGEDGKLKFNELLHIIETEGIKTVLINFPNNPSGIAVDRDTLAEFAEFARDHDIVIISDEVYNRIRFRGEPVTMLSFAPERTVVVSAASKEYLIPGERVGYVISTSPTLTDVFFKKIIRCQSSCPPIAGQDIFIKILKKEVDELRQGKSPSFLKPVIEKLKERREKLGEALREAGFHLFGDRLPDGTIFMLAKLPEEIKLSDVEFVEKALELRKISAIPGSACGKPGWLRFCFGSMKLEDIERFKNNLKEMVNSISKKK